MGKPFDLELQNLSQTLKWANSVNLYELAAFVSSALTSPMVAIGSGGSLTAAHFSSALHEQAGNISRAVTPLHFASTSLDVADKNVLLFTAGGGNPDILSIFKLVVEREPRQLIVLCMKHGTPIASLAQEFGIGKCIEYDLPSGKDGFLAVNSLAAFCVLLGRAYAHHLNEMVDDRLFEGIAADLHPIDPRLTSDSTFVTLFGFWGSPAALDFESKCTEAGLANVQISDFRNFGHGRHHWLAKHPTSTVLALVTPEDSALADKTLKLIPDSIKKIVIRTPFSGSLGGIHLLLKSFYLVSAIGRSRGIDPGRPGVPDFGRRLYRLSTPRNARVASELSKEAYIHIRRKLRRNLQYLSQEEIRYWVAAYKSFLLSLEAATFGGIIFDYDGTLADLEHRFKRLPDDAAQSLVAILKQGVYIGIATGRGKSVRQSLQASIPSDYWGKIFIGYYNGADIGLLSDNSLPYTNGELHPTVIAVTEELKSYPVLAHIADWEVRPKQVSLVPKRIESWAYVRGVARDILAKSGIEGAVLVESTHSLDILPSSVSKLHLKLHLESYITHPSQILCIGDTGAWPGNDHSLLSTEYSLSVDTVSPDPAVCWNLAPPGFRGVKATLRYLDWLSPALGGVRLKVERRMRS